MKKNIAFLLVLLLAVFTFACAGRKDNIAATGETDTRDTSAVSDEAEEIREETETVSDTESASEPAAQGKLLLNAASMTFTVVGESDDLYCGSIPRDLITWESADETVATVENGIVMERELCSGYLRRCERGV